MVAGVCRPACALRCAKPFSAVQGSHRTRRGQRPPALRATPDEGNAREQLPEALQGLQIREEDGELIDTSTGKVVNEFGATRFDVAVQAMRGAFDPPAGTDNTERASGVLLDSLVQFPSVYPFQVVLRQGVSSSSSSNGSSDVRQTPAQLLERYRGIIAEACGADVPAEQCSVKERLGGKYVSLTIPARVPAAAVVQHVLESLKDDAMVVMRF